MRYGSLFSGILGLDVAVEHVTGATPAWRSEIDPPVCAWYQRRDDDVPNLGDITRINWKEVRDGMAAHRNDEMALAMYARYRQGLSLAEVGKEFDRSRQAVWELLKARDFDLRPRPPALPSVEWGGRTFSLANTGYYRATDGDRELMHRFVWSASHGPIPAGHDVHHRNHDRTDNRPENLALIDKAEHTRHHARVRRGEVMPTETQAIDILIGGFP